MKRSVRRRGTGIARDAGINRRTVQNHFEILTDTLIGFWLPPWKLKSATRQVRQSKFYFFDCGVARALTGRLPYPPTAEELGPLAETLVLNELRAYLGYSSYDYWLCFGATTTARRSTSFARRRKGSWRLKSRRRRDGTGCFNRVLHRVRDDLGKDRTACYGVYLGQRAALWDDVRVLPLVDFLKRLWAGEIIGAARLFS